jgi:hypothetical protein
MSLLTTFVELFGDIQFCPVCGRELRLIGDEVRQCPGGDIQFILRKDRPNRRWISIAVPKSPVRIKETGEVFPTQLDVAKHIQGSVSMINDVLSGKRKHYKGLTFEFADDVWELP